MIVLSAFAAGVVVSATIVFCAFALDALAPTTIVLCAFTRSMLVLSTPGTGALGAGVEPAASP